MLDLLSRIFFSVEFLSVVLMDMPKVASVIGLLSSDESSDSNEAMPARKKQRVRQYSSTTFQEVVKTWPCIQPLKTDSSKATCILYDFPHICINITSMIFPGIKKKGWMNVIIIVLAMWNIGHRDQGVNS